MGYEFVGVVIEIGSEVINVVIGDCVVGILFEFCMECNYCKVGDFVLCDNYWMVGLYFYGGFVENVVMKVDNVIFIGDFDFEEGVMIELFVVLMYGVFGI